MKTSKPTLKKSDQGECGVWLDTAELKGKANQVEYQIITNIRYYYQHDAIGRYDDKISGGCKNLHLHTFCASRNGVLVPFPNC